MPPAWSSWTVKMTGVSGVREDFVLETVYCATTARWSST
jgi:hypothetical protein